MERAVDQEIKRRERDVDMCNRWNEAYIRFNWRVDPCHFKGGEDYLDFFNRVIEPPDVKTFEDRFRATIDGNGSFYDWKNGLKHIPKIHSSSGKLTGVSR